MQVAAEEVAEYVGTERRSKPRLFAPFPAIVHGVNVEGKVFNVETILENISAYGLYMRLPERVEKGRALLVVCRLSIALTDSPAPLITVNGIVLRIDSHLDETYGVALEFTHKQFL